MTLLQLLLLVLGIVVVGLVAYWLINKFFPEPAKMVALAVVGVVLLVALLYGFFPGVFSTRIG